MKEKMNIAFVIDKSGSMYSMAPEVIKGFNRVLEEHKEPEMLYTVCVFNDHITFPEVRTPAPGVEPLTEKSYHPDCCTALNDAMGKTIKTMEGLVEKGEKVLFFVLTDGMENASTDYTTKDIKKLVEEKNKDGWEFIFMGANIDAAEEAAKRGVARSADFVADDRGADLAMCAMSEAGDLISNKKDQDGFDAEVKKDYKKRGK